MSSFLRKDLMWWNELVFQNEFAGLPMELFEKNSGYDEAWPIVTDSKKITLTSMRSENAQCSEALSYGDQSQLTAQREQKELIM
ncbi:hypothetical protein PC112_g4749 [Phytophthora cactorum]|nr:hypothetical protein PC112_g4749 [Phytophthora cactorum]